MATEPEHRAAANTFREIAQGTSEWTAAVYRALESVPFVGGDAPGVINQTLIVTAANLSALRTRLDALADEALRRADEAARYTDRVDRYQADPLAYPDPPWMSRPSYVSYGH